MTDPHSLLVFAAPELNVVTTRISENQLNGGLLAYRVVVVAIGLAFVFGKSAQYRRHRRAGTAPRDPRFERAGRFAVTADGAFLHKPVFTAASQRAGWPQWLFYPFFAPLLLAIPSLFYAAYLFGRAGQPPSLPDA
jgi:hypothetical protein